MSNCNSRLDFSISWPAINWVVEDRITNRPHGYWNGTEPRYWNIALELKYLKRLGEEGWWGDYGYCMYAEEVLRQFGPVVADAAVVEGRRNGEMEIADIAVITAVLGYLRWLRTHEDNEPIRAAIERAEKALLRLDRKLVDNKLECRRAHQTLAAE